MRPFSLKIVFSNNSLSDGSVISEISIIFKQVQSCFARSSSEEILFSLRSHGWFGGTRFYSRKFASYNKYAKRFTNLDPRYIFINSGFNLRPTDINAAIGIEQLKRIKKILSIRKYNFLKIKNELIKNKKLRQALSIQPLLLGGNPTSTTSFDNLIHFYYNHLLYLLFFA